MLSSRAQIVGVAVESSPLPLVDSNQGNPNQSRPAEPPATLDPMCHQCSTYCRWHWYLPRPEVLPGAFRCREMQCRLLFDRKLWPPTSQPCLYPPLLLPMMINEPTELKIPQNFYNAYLLSENGGPNGTGCSLYTQTWNKPCAINCVQNRGADIYIISNSYGFTLNPWTRAISEHFRIWLLANLGLDVFPMSDVMKLRRYGWVTKIPGTTSYKAGLGSDRPAALTPRKFCDTPLNFLIKYQHYTLIIKYTCEWYSCLYNMYLLEFDRTASS